MNKRTDIPRIMIVAESSVRCATLNTAVSRALNGRVHITAERSISVERFSASGSHLLIADLDTEAAGDALIAFLESTSADAIALIDNPEPLWVRAALDCSIRAILARDAAPNDLLLSIQAADAGLMLLHPSSAHGLGLAPESYVQLSEIVEELTARECQVLRLVGAGLGNKEIAQRLSISGHTVKFHISSILGKLNVASRTEAVALGIRRGLIPI